ncbi:hypothetical protein [Klenkia taihuensis]|uniref:Tryptophan-associated transmembrane protein (Trp_oprn_chp) n=1 Tax=Klenkia taihuensis TaxID=1225127 RepID=A0A1I1T3G4_9ACTN|nr:hypothetical protein [Klenkia taihuensis]GHE13012.1 hypothetical protein GCM10011381_33300 [Klenkia taihuensis]SFD53206.1 hypothetical protein SAMN05661030_3642 [Klenkia taihuensis]
MTAPQPPVRRVPPIPAGLAVVCALLGALPVAVFSFVVGAFSAASGVWQGVLLGLVPGAVAVLVVAGTVLLLTGRSWRVLVVGSVLTLALVVWALAQGAASGDTGSVVVLVAGPLAAALLASLPSVRAWVDARRAARV